MSMEAIERTFKLLVCLAENPDGLGLNRLAQMVDLAPSTTFRYLSALVELGYLSQGTDKRYRITTRLYALGLAAAGNSSVNEQLRTGIDRLASRTGETVLVTVRHGLSSLCVAQQESSHRLKITAHPGSRQDLRLGASGRVLLASLPEDEIDMILAATPIPQLTAETITSAVALKELIAKVKSDGYCVSVSEIDAGVLGVAAPLRDQEGLVVAAISVVAPVSRSDSEVEIARLIETVTTEAARMSPLVGHIAAGVPDAAEIA